MAKTYTLNVAGLTLSLIHISGHFPVGPQTRREEAPCIPF